MSSGTPLSPRDITHQSFDGRVSGYDKAQVRAYLRLVAHSVEALLHEHRQQAERLLAAQAELEEKKQAEDEIRRAIVSAERLSHELRENAAREAALLLEQARAQVAQLRAEHTQRAGEDERRHAQRLTELDTAFRNRYAELERDHHDWLRTRERQQSERLAELERQFHAQHQELSGRLAAARQEYAHFLSAYRALLASFGELSLRHTLPEEVALPLSVLTAPEAVPDAGHETAAQPAPEPAWVTPEVLGALPELPPGLADALLEAGATPLEAGPLPDGSLSDGSLPDGLPRPLALNLAAALQGLPDAAPVYATSASETARLPLRPDPGAEEA